MMTEKKRFILTEQFNGLQGVTFVKDDSVDVDTYYTVDGAVDLLNELHDENQSLKQYKNSVRDVLVSYAESSNLTAKQNQIIIEIMKELGVLE